MNAETPEDAAMRRVNALINRRAARLEYAVFLQCTGLRMQIQARFDVARWYRNHPHVKELHHE
jgi:hypothetical protein